MLAAAFAVVLLIQLCAVQVTRADKCPPTDKALQIFIRCYKNSGLMELSQNGSASEEMKKEAELKFAVCHLKGIQYISINEKKEFILEEDNIFNNLHELMHVDPITAKKIWLGYTGCFMKDKCERTQPEVFTFIMCADVVVKLYCGKIEKVIEKQQNNGQDKCKPSMELVETFVKCSAQCPEKDYPDKKERDLCVFKSLIYNTGMVGEDGIVNKTNTMNYFETQFTAPDETKKQLMQGVNTCFTKNEETPDDHDRTGKILGCCFSEFDRVCKGKGEVPPENSKDEAPVGVTAGVEQPSVAPEETTAGGEQPSVAPEATTSADDPSEPEAAALRRNRAFYYLKNYL